MTLEQLKKMYPDAMDLVEQENREQHPEAKFVCCFEEDEDDHKMLNIYYVIGSEKKLWCWVFVSKDDPTDCYIDEYQIEAL